MPIVGFNLNKVLAEKTNPVKKGIKAAHNISVTSINEEKLKVSKNSEKTGLKFEFEFSVDYQPKIGNIIILGHILYLEDEKIIKEILDYWNKNKKISPELTATILNTAIVKCTIKAMSMSQEINLPPHLPLPLINPSTSKTKDYIG